VLALLFHQSAAASDENATTNDAKAQKCDNNANNVDDDEEEEEEEEDEDDDGDDDDGDDDEAEARGAMRDERASEARAGEGNRARSEATTTLSAHGDTTAPLIYRARFAFEAGARREMSLAVGALLHVKKRPKGGWWRAVDLRNGAKGWVPKSYLRKAKPPLLDEVCLLRLFFFFLKIWFFAVTWVFARSFCVL
jgi:hypothetical protein